MLNLDSLKAAYNMKSLVNNKNEEMIAIEKDFHFLYVEKLAIISKVVVLGMSGY